MQFFLAFLLPLVAVALNPSVNATLKSAPDTVDKLDVSKYLGLWYQMAADKIVYSTFEKDAYCATALYGDNGDGTISVHNYAAIGSPSGSAYDIDGYAYVPNADEPGQLKVVFNSDAAFPFPAPYWVLELGPENADGLYDYSIVSDNFSLYLFVLARDVDTFNAKYKDYVSQRLVELGFTGANKPIDTYQEKDCVYESTLRKSAIKKMESKAKDVRVSPKTVDSLDLNAYVGKWYNTYTNKFSVATTTPNGFCSTAMYALQTDGSVSVHNADNIGSPTGEVSSIDGYAYYAKDNTEPGQFKLHLDGVPVEGDYWVYAVGPVANKMYDWSIVSDPKGRTLYVLARDADTFKAKYETDVLAMLEDMGFTSYLSAPIPMYQGADCAYDKQ